ncbi:MAG: hypothetical protein H7Y38_19930 [Armatimonadetes bacterium]|nr:hypothetical protein [Armatimonadota bacterium]
MSDILNAAQAVADDAHKRIRVFSDIPADDVPLFGDTVHGALLRACRNATDDERDAALRALEPIVRTAGSYHVGIIAIVCGTLVEWGGNPAIVASALLDRLTEHVALATVAWLREDNETPERLFERNAEAYGASRTIQFALLATMAIVCRDIPARQYARATPGLVDALEKLVSLEPFVPEADFLLQVLALTDGMNLTILHPETRRGYRVSLEAVGSNFHLFTLLQGALIGDPAQGFLPGTPISAVTMAIAKGEVSPDEDTYDVARFQFYNWFALKPDGTIDGANIASWIWGEGSPADIAPLDGERIVVLGETVLAIRSWSGFFLNIHTALRSDVRVTAQLSDAEVTTYIDRIKAQKAP